MFASHEVTLDADPCTVRARLVHLISCGEFRDASQAAYDIGRQVLIGAGPAGTRSSSRLMRVRLLPPTQRGSTVRIPLRWEVTGPAGALYPVLDGDLVLSPQAETNGTRLGLVAVHRPPCDANGKALDRALMNRIAAATARSLLETLTAGLHDALAGPLPHWHLATTQ